MESIFNGICSALITPFKQNKKIDYQAFKNLIENQIHDGVDAILILGTTGEASTITNKEHKTLIQFAKKIINNRTKLLVGCGCNCTLLATKYAKLAENLKTDGAVIVTPYYNKCSQNGLIEHYSYIANHTNIPIIVYNVPSRTSVNIEPETMLKLTKIKNIVGIKEANTNLEHIDKLFKLLLNKTNIYCGTDELNNYFFSRGGNGAISVLSIIEPKKVKALWELSQTPNTENDATELSEDLKEQAQNLFVDINPIPIKYILFKRGFISYEFRLPLIQTSIKNEITLNRIFKL